MSFTLEPIGYLRTGPSLKFDAPNQPRHDQSDTNRIELLAGRNFELALSDLEGFDRIWLIGWFHRSEHWRPRVLPPRGPAKRRGVFATRSPHRPNPISLTCVRLLAVHERTLEIGPVDLVEGTPILDIKPYLVTADCFPESSLGWVAEVERQIAEPPAFSIAVEPRAQEQLNWLAETWGIDFTPRAFEILSRDPSPHRTRRILALADGRMRLACGPWRVFYQRVSNQVQILEIGQGYSLESLAAEAHEKIQDRDAQLAFVATFGVCK